MHKDEIKHVSPHGSNTMLAAAAGNLKLEVRIGNWVAFKKKDKGGYDCTTITQSCFKGNYIEKAFKPEPLSFQWLENFGFKKSLLEEGNPEEGYYYSLHLSDDKYCNLSILSDDKNGYVEACLFPYEESFRVRYVHQLQNLFYAIIGKELRHIKSGSSCR